MAQGALGAAGVRRVWAGAGLQRTGTGDIARLPAQLVTVVVPGSIFCRMSLLPPPMTGMGTSDS